MEAPSSPQAERWLYPELGLQGRLKLAESWIPDGSMAVLDAGCSYGYGTRHFARRAAKTVGIDPNANNIAVAQRRYPELDFRVNGTEAIPFPDAAFDVVIMADVLEHVADEGKTLDEVYRVLKPGGRFVITVPHKGLFDFLDVDNLTLRMRRALPALYAFLYRFKEGRAPGPKPGYDDWHRHYSLRAVRELLDRSRFSAGYRIDRVERRGLFVELLVSLMYQGIRAIVGPRLASRILPTVQALSALDYRISYGTASANLAVLVTKTPSPTS